MSPHTAHSCDGLCGGHPGEEDADEDALSAGGGRGAGLSLLLVDSDLWSGSDARLCLAVKAVPAGTMEIGGTAPVGNVGNEYEFWGLIACVSYPEWGD